MIDLAPNQKNHQLLISLHGKISQAIDELPPTDSYTLSNESLISDEGEGQVRTIIDRICNDVDEVTRARIQNEFFQAGPIEALLRDASVTEIIINGEDSIWFEKAGRLERLNDIYLSSLSYRNFIARMCRDAGMQPSIDCPYADGTWQGARAHILIPPASGHQPVVTLRRHPLNPWTLESLAFAGWARPDAMEELQRLVSNHANFLVVGGTGSGKTSVLNACLKNLSHAERALIIEDTNELKVPNAVSTKLLTRFDPQGNLRTIDQSDLVRQALRMRPDRIVMGEIRGGEAKDLLMAFATGHTGCMGTLHAESARQALIRLEMLIQLGAPQWNLQAVRTLIWLSVKALVVVARGENGSRKLEGIYKISSLEDVGFLLEKVV